MEANVYFVEKASNSPNVHQARPIEKLWGILAQEVYEEGWQASTQQELISRIQLQIKKFDSNLLQNLMGRMKTLIKNNFNLTDNDIRK